MIKQVFYKTVQIYTELQAFMSDLLRKVSIETFKQIDSSYVTTWLSSIYSDIGQPRVFIFPERTVCDMLLAHLLLRRHLEPKYIHAVKRGDFRGGQMWEWAIVNRSF